MRPDTALPKDLFEVFFPYARARHSAMRAQEGLDFAHYTSASDALRILRNREVTLRRSSLLNDFSEIDHGERCVANGWKANAEDADLSDRFIRRMRQIDPKILPGVKQAFDGAEEKRKTETYLLSLSEHDDTAEGQLGRLSMWRAYGGKTNVAIIIDPEPLLRPSGTNMGFLSPVLYCHEDDFRQHFRNLMAHILKHSAKLQQAHPDQIVKMLSAAFHAAAMSTKHPGFAEEKEWRIIYAPWMAWSEHLAEEIIEIEGVPQRVCKIKLQDRPEVGLFGMEPDALFKKIIIGPTEKPDVLYDAFVRELEHAGVEDAPARIVISDIPIGR